MTKGRNRVSSKSESGSSSGSPSPSGRSRSGTKHVANGNVVYGQQQVAYDKFSGMFYDYSLPDRGLGSAAVPARVSPPQQSPKNVAMPITPGWSLPTIPYTTSVPSPTLSEKNRTSPLDLSAQPSKEVSKQPEALPKNGKKNTQNHPAKVPPSKTVSDNPENITTETSLKASSSDKEVASPVAHYDRNILIFGEKAVEIISVGNNKWIVRNEDELCQIASGELIKKNHTENCLNSASCSSSPSVSPRMQVKRLSEGQGDSSESSPLKVPRLNGTDSVDNDTENSDSGANKIRIPIQTQSLLATP
ncbi:hypothetical protein FSP39_007348 [Pinctada imbricata]|uniref:Uncharacterized protein n=1 Tax=Pinctada imbricata TaxID=66713 RepID=A0AA89C1B2_PINIB|nr:hypothetical protein FSP39_007348 [Pinctada imbricata]